MESELERFHKQNTQLELNITELRQKLKATEKEMHGERQRVRDVEAVVRRFKTDLHNCVGYIQDPKLLKESIRALYQKHVQEDIVSVITSFQRLFHKFVVKPAVNGHYFFQQKLAVRGRWSYKRMLK